MDTNNNQPAWWASSDSNRDSSSRISAGRAKSTYINRPGWMTIIALLLVAATVYLVGLGLQQTSQNPNSRITEFGSVEYYTDVITLNESCTNVYAFGEPDYYGVIDKSNILTEASIANHKRILSSRLLEGFTDSEKRYLNLNDYSESYYSLYPIQHHMMSVPVSGYMESEGLTEFEYASDEFVSVEKAVRSLYDGKFIIWYNPDSTGVLKEAKEFLEENSEVKSNTHLVPWNYSWDMPNDSNAAVSTWNMSLNCGTWSDNGMEEFLRIVNEHGHKYRPEFASPPIFSQEDGQLLPPIMTTPLETS